MEEIEVLRRNNSSPVGFPPGPNGTPTPNDVSFKLELVLILLTLVFVGHYKLQQRRGGSKKKYPFPTVRHTPFKLPEILEGCWTLAKLRWEGFKAFDKWYEQHGHIFELPFADGKCVCLMDPTHIQKVLRTSDPAVISKPRFLYDRIFVENLRGGLVSSGPPLWNSHRKMLNRAFTYKALRTYLNFMNDHAKTLSQKLGEACRISEKGERTISGDQMFDLIYFYSLKIVLQMLMGEDRSRSDEDSLFFSEHFRKAKDIVVYRFLHSELMLDSVWWFHPKRREFNRIFKSLADFVGKTIDIYKDKREMERRSGSQENGNDSEEDEDPLLYDNEKDEDTDIGVRPFRCLIEEMLRHDADHEEIFSEVCMFISAGHETMTVAINFFMWHLACNSEHQERCREEVDAILDAKLLLDPEDTFLTMEDLHDMKHMERCILEGLRLTPTIPLFARELTAPFQLDKDLEFDPGTIFMFAPSVIQMDPKYFPNPEKFDPDRFLPENVKGRAPCTFYPFSLGPRNCIGHKMTLVQIKVIVGWMLRHFEICTKDRWEDMRWMFEITLMPHKKFDLTLKKRTPKK